MKSTLFSVLDAPRITILLLTLSFGVRAQYVTNLHIFKAGPTNGDRPYGSLIQGRDGYFYGTTRNGGSASVGTVFRISSDGTYTNLYSFASTYTFDGWQPLAGLVQGTDGNFYGTTSMKGTNSCSCGNIFCISPSGNYTNLHYFAGGTNDGSTPNGALIQGTDANFYGTATAGGRGTHGSGVVFRISPGGVYTNIYSFGADAIDGSTPVGALVQGRDGNLYGTTLSGGSNNFGTIFRIDPNGSNYAVLHRFAGGFYYGNNDGLTSYGSLVEGPDGYFYGTASQGGTNSCSCGVVYRISPGGSYTTLYSFADSPDGANPQAGLVLGSDGNFYGTTFGGGKTNFTAFGTIFRISPGGQYTNLYSITTPGQGEPGAPLVQGSDGNFYGTTELGGENFNGTVFKLVAGLSPSANQITRLNFSGSDVLLTIASVAHETYQLQYSTDLFSGGWSNAPSSPTNSMGGPMTISDSGGALFPKRYYRLVITP
jgi:uncharacterized repeat protein (TIGR03803 family)